MLRAANALGLGMVAVALAYLLLLVVVYAFQRSLLFHPTRLDPRTFAQQVQALFGSGARVLAPYDAIVIEPTASVGETAIVFHGNGGAAIDREELALEFAARGVRPVLAEYPGYGPRKGQPSETAIVDDAVQLYAALATLYPEDRLTVVGESVGSGVAAQLVASGRLPRPPARLVLITPLVSVPETAARIFWFLPVRWLARDRFEVPPAFRAFHGPVHILIAESDEVVGARQGRTVAALAGARGRTVTVSIANAHHNDWWARASPADWDALIGHGRSVLPIR
jgi:alpha-beta hydrolase superfamily lysophospholipase